MMWDGRSEPGVGSVNGGQVAGVVLPMAELSCHEGLGGSGDG